MARWIEALGAFARPPDPRPTRAVVDDIAAELDFHLAMRAAELERAGLAPAAAAEEARRRFGDRAVIERQCRQTQLGERIMLQRFQVAVLIVVVAALGGLLWQNRSLQQDYARTVDALRAQIAELGKNATEKSPAPIAAVTLPTFPRATEADRWIETLNRSPDDWRLGVELGEAALRNSPGSAAAWLQRLWPSIRSFEQRQQLLKPFVLRSLQPDALQVLDLAARDPDAAVANRAFYYLRAIAFRDFAAAPQEYDAWARENVARDVGEVLVESARAFVARWRGCDHDALLAALATVDTDWLAWNDGHDVAAALRADGVVEQVAAWLDGDPRMVEPAARWLAPLAVDFVLLRRWCGGDRIHRAAAEATLRRPEYRCTQAQIEALLADDDAVWRRVALDRLATTPVDGEFVARFVVPRLAGTIDVAVDELDALVRAAGQQKWEAAVVPLIGRLTEPAPARSPRAALRFAVATALRQIGDARAIPPLIAVATRERTGPDGLGAATLALCELTGVAAGPGHDAAFWQHWWQANRSRFPEAARAIAIPELDAEDE